MVNNSNDSVLVENFQILRLCHHYFGLSYIRYCVFRYALSSVALLPLRE